MDNGDIFCKVWADVALACSVAFLSTVADAEMARYEIDPEHTTIGFSAGHMMVSQVQGQFMVFDGFVEMDPEAKIVNAIEATIKTWSINTNHQKRDAHLRSPDFLDVERYPTMTYKLKSYRKSGEHDTAIGDLNAARRDQARHAGGKSDRCGERSDGEYSRRICCRRQDQSPGFQHQF